MNIGKNGMHSLLNFPKIHQTLLPLHMYVATIQYDVDFVHTLILVVNGVLKLTYLTGPLSPEISCIVISLVDVSKFLNDTCNGNMCTVCTNHCLHRKYILDSKQYCTPHYGAKSA